MRLAPDELVTPQALARGERRLVQDSAWASLAGALSGGVILSAFALELGATPSQIGLLAAIPFLAQAAQLPAIALVERVRQRRKVGVLAISAARVVILGQAFLPLLAGDAALGWLMAAQAAVCVLVAVGSCAVNGWLHQLIPHERLGRFFSRRLLGATALACVGTLAAGWWVEQVAPGERVRSFALAFALAALAGGVSSWCLAQAPEPRMLDAGPPASTWSRLRTPFADANFRRVLVFLGSWNVASNLAGPFLTVYLIRQLGYPLTVVTTLWVSGQVANALTLYLWGRLTDRFSNKAVLSVALPTWFGCMLGLVFCAGVDDGTLQLALLYGLHVLMGAAGGGIGLATGNMGLKLASPGHATAYLATIGLVSSIAGGLAPLAGGALAQWFETLRLAFVVQWEAAGAGGQATVLAFAHWEFLFALSSALGLYVLHALSRVREGEEVSERVVVQQFALEAMRSMSQLSSVGGVLGTLFPFERLAERRRLGRRPMR